MALEDLVPFIDWSPFFFAWELKGKYPQILKDERLGAAARELFADAQEMLNEIVDNKLLSAKGIYGFWPAASDDDDVILFTDERRSSELCRFHMLRQQWKRRGQSEFRSLADYVAPVDSGREDYIGAFAVTTGLGTQPLVTRYESEHDDVRAIMVKALADRLVEAFAEKCHLDARRQWGYGKQEELTSEQLVKEQYRGIRPAHGYPACPDHTEKRTLFDLMDVETNVGMELTENFAMVPAASVSGLYFAHPRARYFAVDRLDRDQVADYARRKQRNVAEIERWLGPNLGYQPG